MSSQPVNDAPDKENDSEMLDAAHALLELSSECPYSEFEALETTGIGSIPICLETANQGTQAREFERIVRKHWIEKMLYHPKFYTGLKSRELIEFVLGLVKDKAERLTIRRGFTTTAKSRDNQPRKLSTWDEFLLILFRLRRGAEIVMTAHLFGISVGLASNIFITWTLFLEKELSFLRRFASARCNEKHIPEALRNKNGEPKEFVKGLRSIIDAVEFRWKTRPYQLHRKNSTVHIIIPIHTSY